jgi:hypothetical protein
MRVVTTLSFIKLLHDGSFLVIDCVLDCLHQNIAGVTTDSAFDVKKKQLSYSLVTGFDTTQSGVGTDSIIRNVFRKESAPGFFERNLLLSMPFQFFRKPTKPDTLFSRL